SDANAVREEESVVFDQPFPILDLPKEIMTNIIRKMSMKDRASFALVNDYLNELEKKAGHRSFESLTFVQRSDGKIMIDNISLADKCNQSTSAD
ncbi:hypothetical protein PENTCL1PPCAC_5128, partial [Pristionchus entomophagus]